jgi:hypothetical protein
MTARDGQRTRRYPMNGQALQLVSQTSGPFSPSYVGMASLDRLASALGIASRCGRPA